MSHERLIDSREKFVFATSEIFTEGKNPPKNEDAFGYNETSIVLSDGATDKSGQDFEGRSGGEIASELVVNVCLSSDANGLELVNEVSNNLIELYQRINPKAIDDSAYRFAATMVIARVVNNEIVITQIGDTSFRINGSQVYTNNKLVDNLTAEARKHYIASTGDVAGSREFIMPLLKAQHRYQNNADAALGYGVIDGTPVPEEFVKLYTFPANSVHTIEIVSDGYYSSFPDSPDVASYENLRQLIEDQDPNKCGDFASTKLNDDRTVLIANLSRDERYSVN